ncbi:MAG: DUF1385 domain-containing protein [Thermoplasmatales archaeon]|nr:DUF1385 domain-containing protein [Thermoplasmatales archaeon]
MIEQYYIKTYYPLTIEIQYYGEVNLTKEKKDKKNDFIHGESFADGVMFNNDRFISVAYRDTDNKIKEKIIRKNSIFKKHSFLNYFIIIRGLINFFEGSINQMISRNQIYRKTNVTNDKINKFSNTLSVFLILIGGFILYFLIPTLITFYLRIYEQNYNILYGIEVLIRFFLFIILFITFNLSTGAKKTSYFHGAEHKTILCHLYGEKITPENVKKYSIYNPSCGTNLIFLLLLVSIPIFYFFNYENIILRILIMLILLPFLFGLAFEISDLIGIRAIKKRKKIISKSFLFQRFNTREPKQEHLIIAIQSLTNLLNADK